MNIKIIIKPTITFLLLISISLTVKPQGYYKDIFMDGGIKLTSMTRLPAADLLNLTIENFASARYNSTFPPTRLDSVRQNSLITGTEEDLNGILLYPDGAPRFRVLFTNGGKASSHGGSLTETGRDRYRTFVKNGGSYVGSCAGAYLSSAGTINADTVTMRENYLGIWPGITKGTLLNNSATGLFIEKNSPLLKYSDFGGDLHIADVRHNGGCFAFDGTMFPAETEILLRYDYPPVKGKRDFHREINAWAYKESKSTGRVVVTGSHPEAVTSGERLDLMAALLSYGLDGNGTALLKGELQNGKTREMHKGTADNDPAYTMIGDRQYHHFRVEIPQNAENISVQLEGANGYDLFLYMNKDDFAFRGESDFTDIATGPEKEFRFDRLEAGEWYISVECNTTVETVKRDWGYEYTGKTDVLNGVPYNIVIYWD
ncbi:MAG: hypothetical protein LC649_11605 [Bacteroidales bacterium]|nr:hypothetical protein [Bacteroidales bacterium]